MDEEEALDDASGDVQAHGVRSNSGRTGGFTEASKGNSGVRVGCV